MADSECRWVLDLDCNTDLWDTGCKHSFILNDGSPTENSMKFCPFCGLPIAERIVEAED